MNLTFDATKFRSAVNVGRGDQQLFLANLLVCLRTDFSSLPTLPKFSHFPFPFPFFYCYFFPPPPSYANLWFIDFISHTKTLGSSPGYKHLESWNKYFNTKRSRNNLALSASFQTVFLSMTSESHFRNNGSDSHPVYFGFWWWNLAYRMVLGMQYRG